MRSLIIGDEHSCNYTLCQDR